MSNTYKLDRNGFNSGVDKALTLKPVVRAIQAAAHKHTGVFVSRGVSKGKSLVVKERSRKAS